MDSGPGFNAQDGAGYIVLDASGTCAQAKTLPDSAAVTLGTSSQGEIVTCVLSSDTFYIEEDNRSCGIEVVGSNTLNAGDRAYVVGTMATDSNGERYVSASSVTWAGTGLVNPLGMPNKMVGGGNFFYDVATGKGQRGVVKPNGLPLAGLNNIGLLVKTWGRITNIDSSATPAWFTIDDGSAVNLTVDLQPSAGNVIGSNIQTGQYICITGISSCEVSGNAVLPVLRPGPTVPPTFNPMGDLAIDAYPYPLAVTIKSAMLGDIIRYTTDSTDPDESSVMYLPRGRSRTGTR